GRDAAASTAAVRDAANRRIACFFFCLCCICSPLELFFQCVSHLSKHIFARGKQGLISNQKYYIIFFVQIQQQFYSFWNIFILFALPKIDGFA
ncbi:MAG: hypothetical protein ACLVK8_10380, partial [Ruminococcus sp.]